MAQKILTVPASCVKPAPVTIREDGAEEPGFGTVLQADDGTLIAAVSDVLTGIPEEEDDTAGAAKRKAYGLNISDAAFAAVKAKIPTATLSDKLPTGWKARKAKL